MNCCGYIWAKCREAAAKTRRLWLIWERAGKWHARANETDGATRNCENALQFPVCRHSWGGPFVGYFSTGSFLQRTYILSLSRSPNVTGKQRQHMCTVCLCKRTSAAVLLWVFFFFIAAHKYYTAHTDRVMNFISKHTTFTSNSHLACWVQLKQSLAHVEWIVCCPVTSATD